MNEDEKKERDERRIANAMAFIAKHPPRTRAEIKAEEAEERRLWFEEYIRKNPPPTFESLQKRCKPVWVLVVPVSDEFAEKVRASPAEAVRVSVRGEDGVTTIYRPMGNPLRVKLGVVPVSEVDAEGRPVWEKEKAS
jgi:hypothetical protein